jgi:hypothetical protein
MAILESAECATPPSILMASQELPALLGGGGRVRATICRFTIDDFTHGALELNSYLRQSVGEFLPWLHKYDEETCSFTEPPAHVY